MAALDLNLVQKQLWHRGLLAKISEYHQCLDAKLWIASVALDDLIRRDLDELGGMAGEW